MKSAVHLYLYSMWGLFVGTLVVMGFILLWMIGG